MCDLFQCSGKLDVWVPIGSLRLVSKGGARAMHDQGGGGVEFKQVAKGFGFTRKNILACNLLR